MGFQVFYVFQVYSTDFFKHMYSHLFFEIVDKFYFEVLVFHSTKNEISYVMFYELLKKDLKKNFRF